jgi:hypothetical protein
MHFELLRWEPGFNGPSSDELGNAKKQLRAMPELPVLPIEIAAYRDVVTMERHDERYLQSGAKWKRGHGIRRKMSMD